ncbi:MAG: tryptophan synthase subunit alpha [Candidatus Sumerlaeia bacterium]|nr:tryptophan synthase subunit alpha [Candidatus Sumerlaeia bacterium]
MTSRPDIKDNRIDKLFARCREENRAALILFITSGFPDLETTRELLPVLEENGCDLVELGVPFSDPIADGPVIQKASTVALEAGATFPKTLDLLREFRKNSQMPVILFGALNPYLVRGLEESARMAVEAGADGILAADLPFEESGEFRDLLAARNLHLITLIAPTTPSPRIRRISDSSTGFMYCISYKGVTGKGGAEGQLETVAREYIGKIKAESDLPLALGFGIRTPENVRQAVDGGSDGVVVGTALIQCIEKAKAEGRDVKKVVGEYVKGLASELSRKA